MIEFKNVSFHYGGEQGTGEGVDNWVEWLRRQVNDWKK